MWKCPVCETEYDEVTVCPKCGFDGSCDYEHYPTVFAVAGAKSTRTLRQEWEQKQGPPVSGGNRKRTVFITQDQASQGCRVTAGYVDGKRLELTVPAGTKDGSVLRCSGLGQSGRNGGKSGDLLVTVRVQEPPEPDGLYDAPKDPPVNGSDLRETAYVNSEAAAQGCQLRVTLSGGGTRQVTIPGGCTDGKRLRYTGLGQPGRNGGKNGDLLVTVRVQKPEKVTPQVNLKPGEATQGCNKSISFKHKGKKVSLTLPIPAGVIYGEKLHYPRVGADDGTLYDVTAVVEVQVPPNFFVSLAYIALVVTTLPALVALLTCLYDGFSFSTGLAWIIAFVVSSIITTIDRSMDKKKYGPKTPEEKRRCETPREMPPQR